MDVKEIKRLLDALAASEVREFVYETGEYKMTVKRGTEQVVITQPQMQPSAARAPENLSAGLPGAVANAAAAPEHGNYVEVSAPIVGTFYDSPGPEAAAYVKVGDRVQEGTVLCIIEAMKLMNEIEAETEGVVREVLVHNEEPVEYGQVLFRIEPG